MKRDSPLLRIVSASNSVSCLLMGAQITSSRLPGKMYSAFNGYPHTIINLADTQLMMVRDRPKDEG